MADPQQSEEPTLDDLRRICHADTLPLLERGDPNVRAALTAEWKRLQERKPESGDEVPRASFTDDDRDFPLPHESRSWITGRERKVGVLRVPPDTLPESETKSEPPPEKTDVEKATDATNAALTERLEQSPEVQKAINDEARQQEASRVGFKYIEIGSADKKERDDTDWGYNERQPPQAYQIANDIANAAAIAQAAEEARQEVIKRYREEDEKTKSGADASGQAELLRERQKLREEDQPQADLQKQQDLVARQEALRSSNRSALEKLWKLTESNLFWSGGVGMALIALGFRWANAPPKLTIPLLFLAWLTITLSVYRHGFFEARSRFIQVSGNVAISVAIAATLVVAWFILEPSTPTQTSPVVSTSSPSPIATATKPDQPEKPPSLVDLFKSDYPNVIKVTEERIDIHYKEGDNLHITTQVYLDFDAKTQFVGFYIPAAPGRTYDASLTLVDCVQDAIDWMRKNQRMRAGYGGEETSLNDLVFSGRVFLYQEDYLSITEKANIIKAYKQKHYEVQFRGPEYLNSRVIDWHRQHDSE